VDGFFEAAKRIYDSLNRCLENLNSQQPNVECEIEAVVNFTLKSLYFSNLKENQFRFHEKGLSLSGAGCKASNERIKQAFERLNVNYRVFVGNDSLGAIFSAFKNG
jgi:hypothetical protein